MQNNINDNNREKKSPSYDEMREMSAKGYTWDGSQWRKRWETAAKKPTSNRGEIKGI